MKLKELMGVLPSRFKVCIAKDGKTYTIISFSNLDSILHARIFEAEAFMENEVSGMDIGMDKDEDGKDVPVLIVHINRLSNWRTNDIERTDGGQEAQAEVSQVSQLPQELEVKTMKKVVKVSSCGRYPMYVHAAYDRLGNVIRYFLLNRLRGAAPIDPEDVKDVMKIAKAEALDMGFEDVHASTIDYKPKK